MLDVLFFGNLVDITSENHIQLPECVDSDELILMVLNKFPNIANANYCIAVDNQVIQGNSLLRNGDVVAFMPPFSGG